MDSISRRGHGVLQQDKPTCSCSSPPRINSPSGDSTTSAKIAILRSVDSIKRIRNTDTSLTSSRLDIELERGEWCGKASNEYTKPTAMGTFTKERSTCKAGIGEMEMSRTKVGDDMTCHKSKIVSSSGGSCSDYTPLLYDINYVKVSPPKMTRRPKRDCPATTKEPVKLSREAQLQAMNSVNTISGPHDSRRPHEPIDNSTNQVDITTTINDDLKFPALDNSPSVRTIHPPDVVYEATSADNCERSKRIASAATFAPECKSPPQATFSNTADYVTWEDMKARLETPVKQAEGQTITVSGNQSPSNKLVDDKCDGDSITLIKDGDKNMIKFVFTVRLDNDGTIMENSGQTGTVAKVAVAGECAPVMACGTINIKKSDGTTSTGRVSILQPVINMNPSLQTSNVVEQNKNTVGTRSIDSGGQKIALTNSTCNADFCTETKNMYTPAKKKTAAPCGGAAATSMTSKSNDIMSRQQTIATVHTSAIRDSSAGSGYKDACRDSHNNHVLHNDHDSRIGRDTCNNCEARNDRISRQQTSESTHMSWEEVMNEAKTLGIPLNCPAANTTFDDEDELDGRPIARRSSISSIHEYQTQKKLSSATDGKTCLSCRFCDSPSKVVHVTPVHTPAGRADAPQGTTTAVVASTLSAKWAAPLRDRLQNFFGCRKQRITAESKPQASAVIGGSPNSKQQQQKGKDTVTGTLSPPTTSRRSASCARATHSSTGCNQVDSSSNRSNHNTTCRRQETKICHSERSTEAMPSRDGARTLSPPAGGENRRCRSVISRRRTTTLDGEDLEDASLADSPASNHKTLPTEARRSNECDSSTNSSNNNNNSNNNGNNTSNSCPKSSSSICRNRANLYKSFEQLQSVRSIFVIFYNFNEFNLDECLAQCSWYWGNLGFEEAEKELEGRPDGTFLVRDSSDPRYILSLSFRSAGSTHHTRIEHYKGECFVLTATSLLGNPNSHSMSMTRGINVDGDIIALKECSASMRSSTRTRPPQSSNLSRAQCFSRRRVNVFTTYVLETHA